MSKYQVTEERVAELKAKHGKIYQLDIEDEDGGKFTALIKGVDRKTLSAASVLGAKDPVKFNEVALNNAWLEGDEEIKTNDQLFLAASAQLATIVQTAKGELRKL